MAPLPPREIPDPTLAAADAALVARARQETPRNYLGMSSIGHACERRLWYDFHQPSKPDFDADTLKRFEDGHRSEDLMAFRLRMVDGLQLWTVDPATGKQLAYEDHDGRFKGHLDGVVTGLIQAPATPHIWEGKCVNDKKFAELKKLKAQLGEKSALAAWDAVYWNQAQAYMGYADLTRHYLTVCTPGGRAWDAVRTEFDPVAFIKIKEKARRILDARAPLMKISQSPDWWQCRFCPHTKQCHG